MSLSKESTKWLEGLVVLGSGITAGFTFYITHIEIPSREKDTGAYCLANYQHVFPLAANFMKPFGVLLSSVTGTVLYQTKKPMWWIPLLTIGSLGPFTKIFIVDTNEQLMSMKPMNVRTPDEDAKAKELVQKWGKLHNIRTYLTLVGFSTAVVAAMDLITF